MDTITCNYLSPLTIIYVSWIQPLTTFLDGIRIHGKTIDIDMYNFITLLELSILLSPLFNHANVKFTTCNQDLFKLIFFL